jgi:hypothetical protein
MTSGKGAAQKDGVKSFADDESTRRPHAYTHGDSGDETGKRGKTSLAGTHLH